MQSVDSESIPLAGKKRMQSKSSAKIPSEVSKRMQAEPVRFGSKIIPRTSFAVMRPTEIGSKCGKCFYNSLLNKIHFLVKNFPILLD